MKKRQVTLADGRYLIFFTFDDEQGAPAVAESEAPEARREPPRPQVEAGEERGV